MINLAVPMRWLVISVGLTFSAPATHAAPGCIKLSFDGEVSTRRSTVRQPIGQGLAFRMEPTDMAGWKFEIGLTDASQADVNDRYIYMLTGPLRWGHVTSLDTSYGKLAQDVVSPGPRSFWFLLNASDAPAGDAIKEKLLWPEPDTSTEEALTALQALPRGYGVLHITGSRIKKGTANLKQLPAEGDYLGAIYRMKFRVDLVVPSTFKAAPRLRSTPSACPRAREWAEDWGLRSTARRVRIPPHPLERQPPRVRRDELVHRLGPP
jgi:hypothetical protein